MFKTRLRMLRRCVFWNNIVFVSQNAVFKPPIWKTGSTSSICIGCSNNNTEANSKLSAWGFKEFLRLKGRRLSIMGVSKVF